MPLRALALCLALPLLVAATNSSHSSYIATFSSQPSSPELVAAAMEAFRSQGFYGSSPDDLKHHKASLWLAIASPAPGELSLRFTQLRGGCGNYPEVDGATADVDALRQALEKRFGPSKVRATHRANALGQ
jgi:hypothetical protein